MKAVRIKTKDGDIRLCELPAGMDLPTWWQEMRSCGQIIGNRWAMPFDNIAIADLVDWPDPPREQHQDDPAIKRRVIDAANQDSERTIGQMAHAIQTGAWHPPFDG